MSSLEDHNAGFVMGHLKLILTDHVGVCNIKCQTSSHDK